MTYIETNQDGKILRAAEWKFSAAAVPAEREVVRGSDGKLYLKGDEPASVSSCAVRFADEQRVQPIVEPEESALQEIRVINDLVTGGATDALSAQMGVELNRKKLELSDFIAGDGITITEQVTPGTLDEETVALWHFDEGLTDEVGGIVFGNGASCVLSNEEFKFGKCLKYTNGSSGRTADISGARLSASKACAFDFWMYRPLNELGVDFTDSTVAGGGYGHSYGLQISSTSIFLIVPGEINVRVPIIWPADTWGHVAFSRTADGLTRIFFNGKKVVEEFLPGETPFTNLRLYASNAAALYVDELRVSASGRYTTDFKPQERPYSGSEERKYVIRCTGGTGASLPLFTPQYFDHDPQDVNWAKADYSPLSRTAYPAAYDKLLQEINNARSEGFYSFVYDGMSTGPFWYYCKSARPEPGDQVYAKDEAGNFVEATATEERVPIKILTSGTTSDYANLGEVGCVTFNVAPSDRYIQADYASSGTDRFQPAPDPEYPGRRTTAEGVVYFQTANGMKIVDAADSASVTALEAEYAANGVAWYYVLNQTEEWFKLPRNDWFFQGTQAGGGERVQAGLPNITGALNVGGNWSPYAEGAFQTIGSVGGDGPSGNGSVQVRYNFNASWVNPVYGGSTSVQPAGVKMFLYFFVGGTGVNTPAETPASL